MRSLLLFLTLVLSLAGVAQSYDASLGVRVGTDFGATAQLRLPLVHKNFVAEGIIQSSLGKDEGLITVLGKQHQPLLSRRLNLFYGGGLHAGWNNEIDAETGQTFNGPKGITGVVGLEATIGKVNLSYDFKPAVNVGGGSSVLYTQTAVSVRYVIAKRNTIWDKKKEKDRQRDRKARERERKREARAKERERSGKRWYEVWKRG